MFAAIQTKLSQLYPSCRAATELVSAAADRPLGWRERIGLRVHLGLCLWCRRYTQQTHLLRQALARLPAQLEDETKAPPHHLPPQKRQEIQRRLEAALGSDQN